MKPSAADEPERVPAAPPSPAEWIDRHQVYLWRYLRYLGSDPALAEDLAQESFLAGLAHEVYRRPELVARSWLRTTARNLYRMHLRRCRQRVVPLDELDGTYELHTHPDLGASYRAALDACLAALDRRGREVLRLRYSDGMSRTAIATALGLAPEGVKTLLRRTKARLRQCIEKRRQT